ncbi:MAG: class A beta-lactamase-related serine hydrolase [Candidatus Kaiserbacteria bacterium]|nr:class A beta-lactamase-related serine hydrolase [Candidatus Kaiserbacteria bacterium]
MVCKFWGPGQPLIIVLLAVILILAIIIAKKEGNDNSLRSVLPGSSLIDPSRRFYKADDLVINVQPLRDEFNMLEENPNVSLYFEALNTGANISVNKDAEFFPASLIKVPLIMAVAKKIERGEWEWSTELQLTEADKNKEFGTLWQQQTGTRFTIEELVKQVLISSDNTAYFILLNNLDPDELLKVQNHLGLVDFISSDLEISAKKYAPILRSLFSATYLSVENSEKILEWMSESSFNDYLAGGMPPTTKFSHKIGVEDEKKAYLDAGIVYLSSRPYILIVMVKNYDANKADAIMHDVSQRVYDYMLNYPKSI